MAELTHLDEKLAEVLGLAQAAQTATKKVATLARQEKDPELLELLQRMGDEAAKVEQRCDAAISSRDGVRTAIAKKSRETKTELNGFMKTYLENAEIDKIVKFALPLQQAHVDTVREQSLQLAGKRDPTKPALDPMAPLGNRRSPQPH